MLKSKHKQTCVCNLVFTTSKGVVNKAAVDPAIPPHNSYKKKKRVLITNY